jgi:DNA-binding transcriptional ArsR family regulator
MFRPLLNFQIFNKYNAGCNKRPFLDLKVARFDRRPPPVYLHSICRLERVVAMSDAERLAHEDLFSRQGLLVCELAKRLLLQQAEERLAPLTELSQAFGLSVGTTQAALSYLQAQGAVELEARGRLGTFIRALNYGRLWALAYQRPLTGALPLPNLVWLAGLATGIRAAFDLHPLDINLRYMRGALTRLEALSARKCDWALVSRFVADTAPVQGFALETALSFGADSYTVALALVFARPDRHSIEDGLRVGLDPTSIDHTYIVHRVCQDKAVEYVPIDFSQALSLLQTGVIDATCWHMSDLPTDLSTLSVVPLAREDDPALAKFSEAVLLTRPSQPQVGAVLRAVLNVENIRAAQLEVVQRGALPSF